MENPIINIRNTFKMELARLFFISVGVFLFILFFQPFPLEMLDYNDRLLYIIGFGLIIFLLGVSVLILIPLYFSEWYKLSGWESNPPIILSLLFLVLTSTAFSFYIRYVGMTQLTFYVVFKGVLVCLIPLIILIILYKNKYLEQVNNVLQEQNKNYISKIRQYEQTEDDEEIEILSENKSDKLKLKYKNIAAVKSADNYIEIYYLENDSVEKKLVRNTLKNIESQLSNKRNFVRCHRTSIVNIKYVEKLVRSYSGYGLRISCLEERLPVSRQYLMQVKDIISTDD